MFDLFLSTAYAQQAPVPARDAAFGLIERVNDVILFPLIGLMMAIAFLVLLWGAFLYVKNSDSEAGRDTGKNHMLWGTVGILVMVSAYALLSIAAGTFGLQGELSDSVGANRSPFAPVTTGTRPQARPTGATTNAPSGATTQSPSGATTNSQSGAQTSAPSGAVTSAQFSEYNAVAAEMRANGESQSEIDRMLTLLNESIDSGNSVRIQATLSGMRTLGSISDEMYEELDQKYTQ